MVTTELANGNRALHIAVGVIVDELARRLVAARREILVDGDRGDEQVMTRAPAQTPHGSAQLSGAVGRDVDDRVPGVFAGAPQRLEHVPDARPLDIGHREHLDAARRAASQRLQAALRQARVGRHGRDFALIKFRTMVDDPAAPAPRDVRTSVTTIGRVLRRSSLDELPQLWNVVRGEMSFVGPRPTLRYQVDAYDDRQRQRLLVRPGITGLAQVRGRQSISWPERIELDLQYVEHMTWWLDVRVLAGTLGAVLRGTGSEGPRGDEFVDQNTSAS